MYYFFTTQKILCDLFCDTSLVGVLVYSVCLKAIFEKKIIPEPFTSADN